MNRIQYWRPEVFVMPELHSYVCPDQPNDLFRRPGYIDCDRVRRRLKGLELRAKRALMQKLHWRPTA